MKKIEIFILPTCPHCIGFLEKLKTIDTSKYQVEVIDESKEPEKANARDYFFVPTVYIDGVKVHEGKVLPETIQNIAELLK